MQIKPPINPSIPVAPQGDISTPHGINQGTNQSSTGQPRAWFDDLDKGSQLPITAPVSPNLTQQLSIIERVDSIISHLETSG